jgi:sulfonate transport system ATP-binding protein
VPDIRLDRVSKAFDGTAVLREVDLVIPEGSFLSIVGKSGSGKSTLLRIIAGLERASSGRLATTDRLAVAFQEARLLPWLTVADNVSFGLADKNRRAIALDALAEVGLQEKADVWPLTLSGGQAQRVSLARALVRRPEVLLLDEPFGALDALTRLDMQNLVGDLWRAHGWTVIMVTHDVDEAVRLADKVVVLGEGTVQEIVPVPGKGPRNPDDPDLAPLAGQLLRLLGVPLRGRRPSVPQASPTLLAGSPSSIQSR